MFAARAIAILLLVAAVACGLIIPIVVLFSGSSTVPGMMQAQHFQIHLARLQNIAYANGGSRAALSGYNSSLQYVQQELRARASSLKQTLYPFSYFAYRQNGDPTLSIVAPFVYDKWQNDFDFVQARNTGPGALNAVPVRYVQLGCNASDYAGFPANTVALIMRGTCLFTEKVKLAIEVGNAVGVIVFNSPGNYGPIYFTASNDDQELQVPVFGASYECGMAMKLGAARVKMLTGDFVEKMAPTQSLCAETGYGSDVVMVGAHLDSVEAGPGMNDNGSGSVAVLEIAIASASLINSGNKLRFCWWGAEEEGLLGSEHYVQNLKPDEKSAIKAYINLDMVGSKNFISYTFDGTNAPSNVRNASMKLTSMFIEEFQKINKPFRLEGYPDSALQANSDWGPFLFNGIPAGGLNTGASEIKTVQDRTDFGGWANAQADTCYHQPCDTTDNIDFGQLTQNAQIASSVLVKLAAQPNVGQFLNQPPPPARTMRSWAKLTSPPKPRVKRELK